MIIDIKNYGSGGSGSGSTVYWNQIVTGGTKIATVTIDDVPTNVFAPEGGQGGSGLELVNYDDIDTAKGQEIYAHPEKYAIQYGTDDTTKSYCFPSIKTDIYAEFVACSTGFDTTQELFRHYLSVVGIDISGHKYFSNKQENESYRIVNSLGEISNPVEGMKAWVHSHTEDENYTGITVDLSNLQGSGYGRFYFRQSDGREPSYDIYYDENTGGITHDFQPIPEEWNYNDYTNTYVKFNSDTKTLSLAIGKDNVEYLRAEVDFTGYVVTTDVEFVVPVFYKAEEYFYDSNKWIKKNWFLKTRDDSDLTDLFNYITATDDLSNLSKLNIFFEIWDGWHKATNVDFSNDALYFLSYMNYNGQKFFRFKIEWDGEKYVKRWDETEGYGFKSWGKDNRAVALLDISTGSITGWQDNVNLYEALSYGDDIYQQKDCYIKIPGAEGRGEIFTRMNSFWKDENEVQYFDAYVNVAGTRYYGSWSWQAFDGPFTTLRWENLDA